VICNIIMFDKYPTFQICFFHFCRQFTLSHWRKNHYLLTVMTKSHPNMFLGNAESNLCCAASRMPFFPFSWPFTKIVLMRKKLPDAHIRWTIQFILNHKKANMWRKEKINIEKKNNRTKNPPISTQVIQKNLPFPSTLISQNQKKKK